MRSSLCLVEIVLLAYTEKSTVVHSFTVTPSSSLSPWPQPSLQLLAAQKYRRTMVMRRRQQQQEQSLHSDSNQYAGIDSSLSSVDTNTKSSIEDDTTETTATVQPLEMEELLQLGDDEICEVGVNTVEQCDTIDGKLSQLSTSTNLAKCICGAGSFALPHVFYEEGVIGGTVALILCAYLSTLTMKSLADSKQVASASSFTPITSYVQLARVTLGERAANLVFILTLSASLGVCSTYLVFIGQTLESMSFDTTTMNIVRQVAPNVSEFNWEVVACSILYPLSLIRDYRIFSFTSALGVFAVLGGIITTLIYGIYVDPGGGLEVSFNAIGSLSMWPRSVADAFGGSFGTICYLFAVNFLTFPIINSMKNPREYNGAVSNAVSAVGIVNTAFAIVALGFYQDNTQDLVLDNLDNGPYLSALKLLLVVDLLFTFPIVLSSGRQILTNALLGEEQRTAGTSLSIEDEGETAQSLKRAVIVAGAVGATFALAQIGGFGQVANLVGGTAMGTLAFIMPPAISLALARDQLSDGESLLSLGNTKSTVDIALATFGVVLVSAVSYFTVQSMTI